MDARRHEHIHTKSLAAGRPATLFVLHRGEKVLCTKSPALVSVVPATSIRVMDESPPSLLLRRIEDGGLEPENTGAVTNFSCRESAAASEEGELEQCGEGHLC
jgi:hypothetical protein